MKKLFKLFAIVVLLTVGGAALFVFSTDKKVLVLTDGTIKTVDAIGERGNLIFYVLDSETFWLNQDEIKSYAV